MAERRFRLLVVVTGLGLGGTERHLASILPGLVAHGGDVRLVSLRAGGALAPALRDGGVTVLEAPALPAPLRVLVGLFTVFRLCLLWRPAVVHLFLPEAYLIGGIAAWCAGRRPRVMSRRSLNVYQTAHPRAAAIERWLHRRMDALVGNSRAICGELAAEGAPVERIALLPNGVVMAPATLSRGEARAALCLGEGALAIACVANLIPYKGHVDLVEAFARARPALPDGSVLLLIGRDDGMGVALTAQAEARAVIDHVRFLGERSDVADLLAAADMFVLASHEEGSPNAVIEAMAAGLATIVTDVGGSPEAVAETGVVVPPRDPAALADALVRLGADAALRERLGAAAAARAAAEFSREACIARYVALYDALREGRAPASALPATVAAGG
ncbi:MAG: glycosyltransferase [Acetobacteraceae bacterium]|jgi:glycosyltransferase involved in cell wall biosynthesis|nr:glycosyltransferase [Acetobacteraceae bacterium]